MHFRPRFSLRTLFVLVTLFAMWLGYASDGTPADVTHFRLALVSSTLRQISLLAVGHPAATLVFVDVRSKGLQTNSTWIKSGCAVREHREATAKFQSLFPEAAIDIRSN